MRRLQQVVPWPLVITLLGGIVSLPRSARSQAGVVRYDKDWDLDGLWNEDELREGTDAHQSDTDGGGENDSSEVFHGLDPTDPSDDKIGAIGRPRALPGDEAATLLFEVRPEFVRLRIYRRRSGMLDYILLDADAPPTGTYTDNGLVDGSTYHYFMVAEDERGHRSQLTPDMSVTPGSHRIFSDGFESGNARAWSGAQSKPIVRPPGQGASWGGRIHGPQPIRSGIQQRAMLTGMTSVR